MPIADLSTLINATAQNLSQFKGLSFAYNLIGGAPSIAGYTALIKANNDSNFGAGAGTTFNDENVYINTLNALYQGNAAAKTAFDTIVNSGATLSDKLELVYNNLIPVAARTDAGLAYFKSQAAFYEARAIELGVAGANGAALVAYAGLAKIASDNDIGGLGDTVNDLIAAVNNGTAVLPEDGTAFTALETADGTQFDMDDAPVTNPNVGDTFTLTTGADAGTKFTGGNGNDTFFAGDIAGAATWTTGDALDGGNGTDTLKVVQAAAVAGVPTAASLTSVEILDVTSGADITLDTTALTALTSVKATAKSTAANTSITAAATTDVMVTETDLQPSGTSQVIINGGKDVTVSATGTTTQATALNVTTGANAEILVGGTTAAAGKVTVTNTFKGANTNVSGDVFVKGGTEVTVTQALTNTTVNETNVQGAVSVVGDSKTTSVTVNQDKTVTAAAAVVGKTAGAVNITDANAASATAAGTIATVSLNSAGAAVVNSGALTTLNLAGTLTTVNAGTLGALTTAANSALALNLMGATSTGAVTIDTDIKTLNVNASGTASSLNALSAAGATAVNIAGDAKYSSTGETLTAVTAITVTNTAGASLGTELGTGVAFTGGAGADGVLLGATTKAIDMGAGDDTVTISAAPGGGGTVAGGEGKDTLVANTNGSSTSANPAFSGFEVLRVAGAAAQGAHNANGFTELEVGALAAAASFTNVAAGVGLTILANPGFGTTVTLANATGLTDVFNLALKSDAALTANTVNIAGVETVNISNTDSSATTAQTNTLTLEATAAKSVVVTGDAGLTLTNTGNVAITNFDASGVTGTAANAAALGVTFVSANVTAFEAVSIKGGSGDDFLTGSATANDTIIGNDGIDTITYNGGADVFTGGAGNDVFVAAADGTKTNFMSIADLTAGDTVDVAAITDAGIGALTAAAINGAETVLGGAATFNNYLDAAANNTAALGVGAGTTKLGWFKFGGDAYLVVDNTAGTDTFVEGTDSVIKLTGGIDLSLSTMSAGDVLTFV